MKCKDLGYENCGFFGCALTLNKCANTYINFGIAFVKSAV